MRQTTDRGCQFDGARKTPKEIYAATRCQIMKVPRVITRPFQQFILAKFPPDFPRKP